MHIGRLLISCAPAFVLVGISCGGDDKGTPGASGSAGAAEGGQGASSGTAPAGGESATSGTTSTSPGGEPSVGGGSSDSGGASGTSESCGNGTVDDGERCDDGNTETNDGCGETCRIEPGWSCDQGEPTHCTPICGDALLVGTEAQAGGCDDGHAKEGDGCSDVCTVEPGWVCTGQPSKCAKTCDNGKLDAGEGCEDGNAKTGDGCNACVVETGYTCDNTTLPSTCSDVDECAPNGGNNCDANATCKNTPGSFECKCKAGFTGDGVTCTNVDECADKTDNCGAHASCTDKPGSFTCKCNAGYAGDGITCTPRSCDKLIAGCGLATNDDCCASPDVPGGGFTMGTSTVGKVATYELDKYEVTVGRFKAFVNAYTGPPAKGAGAHPLIANSGWQTAWNASIAADKAALTTAISVSACDTNYQTWDAPGTNDFLPINCVDWYEAFAFCAWDGGRLPTDLEWQYALKGGSDNRTYPWGNSPVPSNAKDSTEAYADYNCLAYSTTACQFGDILRVGSRPSGVGKFGQMDLGGSMYEWNLDLYVDPLPATCDNCANLSTGDVRVEHGGAWNASGNRMTATFRVADDPSSRSETQGFRCARQP
jgi:cysteine-rich repeat protein